jgi:hypothetical protein
MAMTTAEKQRAFKERMYKAGYKQVQLWVPRNAGEKSKTHMDRNAFIRKIDELTVGLSPSKLSKLFNDIIRMVKEKIQ